MTVYTITESDASVSVQPAAVKPEEPNPAKPEETTSANPEEQIPAHKKYKFLIWEFKTRIKWLHVSYLTIWHMVAAWSLYTYPFWNHWRLYIYAILLGGMGEFGITAGAHRLWTHKSYKATTPLKLILLFCYSLAGQYSLKEWVRDHSIHHKYTETDADPHNAKRGFFFAHIGWLMMKKHPEVIRRGRQVDLSNLYDDPIVAFQLRHANLFRLMICFVIPTLIPPYLFGESWQASFFTMCFTTYVATLNFTFCVNSFAHLWGPRPYDKRIFPAENIAVCFVAMGEGYHNYHHTFPWDYRTSEYGKKMNITTFFLNIFKYLGWAYDLKTPSPELVKRMIENHGDGSHNKWGREVPVEENSKLTEKEKNV